MTHKTKVALEEFIGAIQSMAKNTVERVGIHSAEKVVQSGDNLKAALQAEPCEDAKEPLEKGAGV